MRDNTNFKKLESYEQKREGTLQNAYKNQFLASKENHMTHKHEIIGKGWE
jgi:hypothetical protein